MSLFPSFSRYTRLVLSAVADDTGAFWGKIRREARRGGEKRQYLCCFCAYNFRRSKLRQDYGGGDLSTAATRECATLRLGGAIQWWWEGPKLHKRVTLSDINL